MAVALAEMTMYGGIGAEVQVLPGGRQDVTLFGEVGGCILLAVPGEKLGELEGHLESVPYSRIGRTGGERLTIAGLMDARIDELRAAYERDLFERYAPEGGHLE